MSTTHQSRLITGRTSVIMLGTAVDTKGGVSSVVKSYADAGFLLTQGVIYIPTHCDGNSIRKIGIALRALWLFTGCLFYRPRFVHTHVASRASFWRKSLFMSLSIAAQVPYIIHLHGADFRQFYGEECGPVRRRVVRYFFEHAARVIVLSESWRQWALESFPRARMEVLYNPIVVPRPNQPPIQNRDSATLLFLGRLGRRKGTYDLVDAVSRLVEDFPSVRLLLAGDGELDEVRAYCKVRCVSSHVDLLGWIQPDQKARLLASSAIYVLPSYNEGLPVSVLEAMAAELPIVSTPVGGIPEAVEDQVEGLLVRPGDVEALAAALRLLLENSDLRITMGRASGRKASTMFSTEVIVPRLEAIYASIN